MTPEKADSYHEINISVQGMTARKSSFLSYAMIEDYNTKPLTRGVHHIGVGWVDLVEAPLDIYMRKYRAHGTVLINLWLGSCGQLMEPRKVQHESHNTGTQNMICKNNLLYLFALQIMLVPV